MKYNETIRSLIMLIWARDSSASSDKSKTRRCLRYIDTRESEEREFWMTVASGPLYADEIRRGNSLSSRLHKTTNTQQQQHRAYRVCCAVCRELERASAKRAADRVAKFSSHQEHQGNISQT